MTNFLQVMSFYRKQLSNLREWKSQNYRKPLVLRGARQVGKTTLVRLLAKEYEQYIELNLEKAQDAAYFSKFDSVGKLLSALLLTQKLSPVDKKTTLLFIDEIQEQPEAIAALRYFYEDLPDLHVIAAGSLLEHKLSDVSSFPVGRVQYLYVFPLNFQEFLHANQMESLVYALEQTPVDAAAHEVAMAWFHKYAMIGGMPEVVQHYVDSEEVSQLSAVYESIWGSYVDDVPKYAKNSSEENVIRHVMRTASFNIDARITFQGFGNSNYRSREVGEAFRALDDAKVIQLIYPSTSVEVPIIPDFRKSPRLQILDTGILNHTLGIQADLLAVEDLSNSYKGALLPHLISQELITLQENSYQKPLFWVRQKKTSQAEVDLVYMFKGLIFPIEIKSGKVGKLRSLHQFMEQCPHPYAVRMYAGKFSIESHKTPSGKPFFLMNLPYYLTTYLEQYLSFFMEEKRL